MDNPIKTLVAQGLQAMKAGSELSAKATSEIEHDAKHPDLKAALEQGNQHAKMWAQRIEAAIAEAGPVHDGEGGNKMIEAHYEVSKKIRSQAKDDRSRDLGIIASGQMALHYWIASFGTQHAYAHAAGLAQTAEAMKQCTEEAKAADQAHTDLALKILQAA